MMVTHTSELSIRHTTIIVGAITRRHILELLSAVPAIGERRHSRDPGRRDV